MMSNLRGSFFDLNVRHRGAQPSIFVRSFRAFTNNTNDPCGSYHDQHVRWDQPAHGHFSPSVLACFQHDPRFRHVPFLLETPLIRQGTTIDWQHERSHLDLIKRALRSPLPH
jgi:hypothetical protein